MARAIMVRFIEKEMPYQRHELPNEAAETGIPRRWLELVAPRGPRYAQPLLVLVGRWTGSMGEGLAVGLRRPAPRHGGWHGMAQLKGAIYSYKLPHCGIGFSFPVERLYRVDGRPRETYRPRVTVDLVKAAQEPPNPDPVLQEALSLLKPKK